MQPTTMQKGDALRVVTTPSQKVALEFQGYKVVEDAPAEQVTQGPNPPIELHDDSPLSSDD